MSPASARVGDLVTVEVGPIAHGGHFVARWEGQVVFVRHALPGELVAARLTSVGKSFSRADTVEVLTASPHRVVPPCPVAGSCGGCDFQHADPAYQRELKRQVVAEQLERLAGIDWTGLVEEVQPVLGWRTRMRYQVDADGNPGLRGSRSNDFVPLPLNGCRIACPGIALPPVTPGATELLAADTAEGVVIADAETDAMVVQEALGRTWEVDLSGFWQSHLQAPGTLAAAVLAALRPRRGERALDLYCGVGLFAGALAEAGCRVTGVEGNRSAVRHAEDNVPRGFFRAGSVERVLPRLRGPFDLVVLDPPRAGAGAAVIGEIARFGPRAIAYVSCDPATLARDLRTARDEGFRLTTLRAFDLFPMTQHVEVVAGLTAEGESE